jgi:hypothetical protein
VDAMNVRKRNISIGAAVVLVALAFSARYWPLAEEILFAVVSSAALAGLFTTSVSLFSKPFFGAGRFAFGTLKRIRFSLGAFFLAMLALNCCLALILSRRSHTLQLFGYIGLVVWVGVMGYCFLRVVLTREVKAENRS